MIGNKLGNWYLAKLGIYEGISLGYYDAIQQNDTTKPFSLAEQMYSQYLFSFQSSFSHIIIIRDLETPQTSQLSIISGDTMLEHPVHEIGWIEILGEYEGKELGSF